jgi:branched-chain amino acid transport system ATP-binding protein
MLELEGVHAAYGSTPALFGLSLTVASGQVAALLGRNGAGKTTTLRSVVRLVTVTAGRVRFRGEHLALLPPHRIAQAGIAYVPEERRIIAGLTVEENLRVTRRSPAARADGWASRISTRQHKRLDPNNPNQRGISGISQPSRQGGGTGARHNTDNGGRSGRAPLPGRAADC